MSKVNEMLELFSFKLDGQSFQQEKIYYMDMPKSWQDYLKAKKINDYKFRMTVQPRRLETKLYALFLEIFNISWKGNPWILTAEKLNVELLKDICLSWFAKEEECLTSQLPEDMLNVSLKLIPTTMAEYRENHSENGFVYKWIPSLMAKKFATNFKGENLTFLREENVQFHHVYFNNTHECITMPLKKMGEYDPFSYVIRFHLKTRGLKPEQYMLNVSFGIRRYLVKPIDTTKGIHYKNWGSILVSLPNPFQHQQKDKFVQLKYKRGKNKTVEWAEESEQFFSDFLIENLDPFELFKEPKGYLESEALKAYIVYSDQMFSYPVIGPNVQAGIGIPEKSSLFNAVREVFSDLTPLPLASKVKLPKGMGGEIVPLRHPFNEGDEILFEVWGNEKLKETVTQQLLEEEILYSETESDLYRLNAEPTLFIRIEGKDPTGIVEALPSEQKNGYARHVDKIERMIGMPSNPTKTIISLVEIYEKKHYWSENTDPKNAIRQGMARCNRLTQFIYPPDKQVGKRTTSHGSRIVNGFYDLLLDAGCLPKRAEKVDWAEKILAVDLIKMKKGWSTVYIPVITKFTNGELFVKRFGVTEWLPLRDSLVDISKQQVSFLTPEYNDRVKFQAFLRRSVEDLLDTSDEDIILLIDAKLRLTQGKKWLDVDNESIELDQLPFKEIDMEWSERVKVVRINLTGDVPQYRINVNGEELANRRQGLFKDASGIYYSIGEKPITMKKAANALMKYDRPSMLIHQQRAIEMIALGTTDSATRDELVGSVHNLRKLSIAYDVHTNRPYPFHMMNAVRKYLVNAELTEDADDFVAEFEEDILG